MASRTDIKDRTRINLDQTAKNLIRFFVAAKLLADITPDTMKEPGSPRKVRLGVVPNPSFYFFQETPEFYTSVSTSTRVN
jgi:hypothetical protein